MIVKCLNASSELFCKSKCKVPNIRPGWNEFVAEQYAEAREAFTLWSALAQEVEQLAGYRKVAGSIPGSS